MLPLHHPTSRAGPGSRTRIACLRNRKSAVDLRRRKRARRVSSPLMAVLRTAAFADSPRALEERTGVEPARPEGRPVSTGVACRSPHLSGKGRWESRTPKAPRGACPVSSGVGLPHARTFRVPAAGVEPASPPRQGGGLPLTYAGVVTAPGRRRSRVEWARQDSNPQGPKAGWFTAT